MKKKKQKSWFVVKKGKTLLPWTSDVLRKKNAIYRFLADMVWVDPDINTWEKAKLLGHSIVKIKIEEINQ